MAGRSLVIVEADEGVLARVIGSLERLHFDVVGAHTSVRELLKAEPPEEDPTAIIIGAGALPDADGLLMRVRDRYPRSRLVVLSFQEMSREVTAGEGELSGGLRESSAFASALAEVTLHAPVADEPACGLPEAKGAGADADPAALRSIIATLLSMTRR